MLLGIPMNLNTSGRIIRAAAAIAGLMIEKYIRGDSAKLYMEPYVLKGDFLY